MYSEKRHPKSFVHRIWYITSRAFILWCQVVCIFQVIGSVKLITGVQVPHCRFVVDQVHSIKKSQKVISLSREECSLIGFLKKRDLFSLNFFSFSFFQFLHVITSGYSHFLWMILIHVYIWIFIIAIIFKQVVNLRQQLPVKVSFVDNYAIYSSWMWWILRSCQNSSWWL